MGVVSECVTTTTIMFTPKSLLLVFVCYVNTQTFYHTSDIGGSYTRVSHGTNTGFTASASTPIKPAVTSTYHQPAPPPPSTYHQPAATYHQPAATYHQPAASPYHSPVKSSYGDKFVLSMKIMIRLKYVLYPSVYSRLIRVRSW